MTQNDTTQPATLHVEEPEIIKTMRKNLDGWDNRAVCVYIDALLAANRELTQEVDDLKAAIRGDTSNMFDEEDCEACLVIEHWPCPKHQNAVIGHQAAEIEQAETRALAAEKALRKASYSFEKISKWREVALAYDRENNNPPRDFCEDVELIEGSAKFSKSEIDAAIGAAAK